MKVTIVVHEDKEWELSLRIGDKQPTPQMLAGVLLILANKPPLFNQMINTINTEFGQEYTTLALRLFAIAAATSNAVIHDTLAAEVPVVSSIGVRSHV